MNFTTIFSASSLLVMPFWLLMIVLPKWSLTQRIMRSPLSVLPAALLYAVLVVPNMFELLPSLANPSLEGISAALGTEAGATIGWIHFLAFDLFVGRWAYLDSQDRGISSWLMAPVLFFVLMFGPLGFVLYLIVQAVSGAQPATLRGSTA